MIRRSGLWTMALCLALAAVARGAETISIEGAPSDTGYNVGSEAIIRATLHGETGGDLSRFAVFADISYIGTTAVSSVQLDLKGKEAMGRAQGATFEGAWLIPAEAPTGV